MQTEKKIEGIEEMTGHRFKNKQLIKNALTHPSCEEEESYERLEFLGDLIIDSIVGIFLFKKYPDKNEAFLTDLKSAYVNRRSLQKIASEIGLSRFVNHNTKEVSNLDNVLESIIGAVYLDGGWRKAENFIRKIMLNTEKTPIKNYKNILFAAGRKLSGKNPVYSTVKESGPPHKKKYTVKVKIEGKRFVGRATATKKKEAEMAAAKELLQKLDMLEP